MEKGTILVRTNEFKSNSGSRFYEYGNIFKTPFFKSYVKSRFYTLYKAEKLI